MESRGDPIEQRNDERHRQIAAMIRRDPSLVEWKVALAMLSPEELADFLESTTPRAWRMRISSPFVGLVPR